MVFSVMSVGTFADFFGHDTQIDASGRSLASDAKGWLWIGTGAGLTLLDTRNTLTNKNDDIKLTYTSPASLLHEQVNDIAIDSAGRAWVGSGSFFARGSSAPACRKYQLRCRFITL